MLWTSLKDTLVDTSVANITDTTEDTTRVLLLKYYNYSYDCHATIVDTCEVGVLTIVACDEHLFNLTEYPAKTTTTTTTNSNRTYSIKQNIP